MNMINRDFYINAIFTALKMNPLGRGRSYKYLSSLAERASDEFLDGCANLGSGAWGELVEFLGSKVCIQYLRAFTLFEGDDDAELRALLDGRTFARWSVEVGVEVVRAGSVFKKWQPRHYSDPVYFTPGGVLRGYPEIDEHLFLTKNQAEKFADSILSSKSYVLGKDESIRFLKNAKPGKFRGTNYRRWLVEVKGISLPPKVEINVDDSEPGKSVSGVRSSALNVASYKGVLHAFLPDLKSLQSFFYDEAKNKRYAACGYSDDGLVLGNCEWYFADDKLELLRALISWSNKKPKYEYVKPTKMPEYVIAGSWRLIEFPAALVDLTNNDFLDAEDESLSESDLDNLFLEQLFLELKDSPDMLYVHVYDKSELMEELKYYEARERLGKIEYGV